MTASPSVLPTNKLVEVAFSSAIHILDKQFGEGYSKKNPQLIATLCQIILDYSPTISGVSPYPTDTDPELKTHLLEGLFLIYNEYINKRLSVSDVIEVLRDSYYLYETGRLVGD